MATIERVYNVPLRREWLKQPKYKRAKKASTALKEFVARTMRVDLEDVKIGKHANEKIWENGIKNPPHHIKVNVTKTDDRQVRVELEGFKYEEKKTVAKKEEKKSGLAGKVQELKESMKPEEKAEEPKEEKKEAAKKEEPKHEHKKEEIKHEAKKEHHAEKKPEHKPAAKKK